MSTRSSPLLGYNNNVRHKGKVFHIQTEDSGSKYGHIMTHLFTDGGRIVKSVKTSYAEYIGSERMGDVVREMMKQQHKAMFIALRDGTFDASLEPLESPPARRSGAGDAPPAEPPAPAGGGRPAAVPPPLPTAARTERSASGGSAPAAPREADSVPSPQDSEELGLDIEGLERAAEAASPALEGADDLPPPPANLLRERTTGPATSGTPAGKRAPPPRPGPHDRRYAPTRPASIFGQARPQQGKTIFGEDPTSDKSLDEVILSYLADDLGEDSK